VRRTGAHLTPAASPPVRVLWRRSPNPTQLTGLLTGGVLGSGDDWNGPALPRRSRERWLGRTLLLVLPLPLTFTATFIEGDGLVQGSGFL